MVPIFFVACALAAALLPDRSLPRASRVLICAVLVAPVLIGLLGYVLIRLEYDLRYYVITDRSLRIRHGVWTIDEITLTYANVQHLEIRQGPIQQMLGIADVVVRTAGGSGPINPQAPRQAKGHRGTLRGIENAREIRDQITALLRRYRHAGLGDPEERQRTDKVLLSSAALERLREIRDALRAWRQASLPAVAAREMPRPPSSFYDPKRRPSEG
jgi:membrane protein YdbS with pleckstrin-like domain